MSELELRTGDLKKIIDAFEQERDKLLDQVQYLKGSAERMEWVIKVLLAQVDRIHKEEAQRLAMQQQQEEALKVARERGNVGVHPTYSERATDLAERRENMIVPPEATLEEKVSKRKKKE